MRTPCSTRATRWLIMAVSSSLCTVWRLDWPGTTTTVRPSGRIFSGGDSSPRKTTAAAPCSRARRSVRAAPEAVESSSISHSWAASTPVTTQLRVGRSFGFSASQTTGTEKARRKSSLIVREGVFIGKLKIFHHEGTRRKDCFDCVSVLVLTGDLRGNKYVLHAES